MEKLAAEGINPSDYIGWYSLRNWDKITPRIPKKKTTEQEEEHHHLHHLHINHHEDSATVSTTATTTGDEEEPDDDRNHFVTELVYIHDKLMIVDDRMVIIGSGKIERERERASYR